MQTGAPIPVPPPAAPQGASRAGHPTGPAVWAGPATVAGAVLAGTALLAVVNPNTTHVPLCPLKATTGLDCPFCGSLRAVHSLTRADVVGAFDHNVLFTTAVPFLLVGWAWWLLRSIREPDAPRVLPPKAAVVAFWVVVFGFGVLRNLPAFGWLGSS